MFNLLEGDGVIENLYHLLWTKDSIFGMDPYVVIPHTILYKYFKPCYWYFSSSKDSKLKKKSSSKLLSQNIKDEFLKKYNSTVDIVAYFIYKNNSYNKMNSILGNGNTNYEDYLYQDYNSNTTNGFSKKTNEGYIIEYLDKKRFIECIESKMPCEDGILQKFEQPKGDSNFVIRLNWSQKMCMFEKKVNIKRIIDNKFNIYERAVTFDGEEFQTETQPMRGNNLPDRIEKIGNSIASHISNVSLERIKIVRMILNFKVTEDDRISLLWCSSLRLENTLDKKNNLELQIPECNVNKISVKPPENVNLFKFSTKGKPIKPLKNTTCLNCDVKIEANRLYNINFKTLIESHENRKRDKDFFKKFENVNMTSSGVEIIPYNEINKQGSGDYKTQIFKREYKNLLIPKVIIAMFPKLKFEHYSSMKTDSIFTSKQANVCEQCFLDITKYCNLSGINTENLIRSLKETTLPSINPKSQFMMTHTKYAGMNQTALEEFSKLKKPLNIMQLNK